MHIEFLNFKIFFFKLSFGRKLLLCLSGWAKGNSFVSISHYHKDNPKNRARAVTELRYKYSLNFRGREKNKAIQNSNISIKTGKEKTIIISI